MYIGNTCLASDLNFRELSQYQLFSIVLAKTAENSIGLRAAVLKVMLSDRVMLHDTCPVARVS